MTKYRTVLFWIFFGFLMGMLSLLKVADIDMSAFLSASFIGGVLGGLIGIAFYLLKRSKK